MRRHILSSFTLLALLASGCASHDSATGTKPDPIEVRAQLHATIASVQLIQDCPDPEPAPAEPSAAAKPTASESMPQPGSPARREAAAAWAGDGPGFRQPCTQSTIQLSLKHDAAEAQRVEIVAVRLMRGSDVLSKIAARKPSKWNDSGVFDAWDERVPVRSEIKVSYRLGEPDWSAVQAQLGADTDVYSTRYTIEVDLKMGGTTTTVRSPEFAREHPHVVVT